MSTVKTVIKPFGLEDLLDRLVTENYIKITKEAYKALDNTQLLEFIKNGYLIFDLSGLFPNDKRYKDNLYFMPLELMRYDTEVTE